MAVFVVESSVKSVTSPCTQRSRSPDRGFSDKSVRGDWGVSRTNNLQDLVHENELCVAH
ncbi:hypothetical protein HMPREF3214_00070 [Alloscardovia omnicolens]|nr:hypothetical protein HMPREF3214_00070 [Alloscardovia omnicolens]